MRKSLIILALTTLGLSSCRQSGKSTSDISTVDLEIVDSTKNPQKPLTRYPDAYIDTEFNYTDSTGDSIIIQNSFPKGGVGINGKRGYTDSSGKSHGFGIFWTRVINETATPLELTINFPADSFAIAPAPISYFKLFLPPGTMTLDKQSLYNYGYDIPDIRSFLDASFDKPTMLQRTINPKEEFIFYVIMLIHVPDNGPIRAGLVSKEQDLFYRFSVDPFGSQIIPCGKIVFNK